MAKVLDVERLCSVDQIGNVEVDDIVASYNVWVDLLDELLPVPEELGLVLEGVDGSADDGCAGVEGEDVAHEGFVFAVDLDDVGDLNHRVLFCVGELPSRRSALDVERQDSQGRQLAVLALAALVQHVVVVFNVHFQLAVCSLPLISNLVISCLNFDP